jgi:hypothetical protein
MRPIDSHISALRASRGLPARVPGLGVSEA